MPNHLIQEHSPYLLQHAENPVDWYPWGPEAFEKARWEDKPVFLSIGYATCHWCHVMARESFEHPAVAELLNRDFVAVKVDREERPDVDAVYMEVCTALNGSGGWPLTILMTPEQKPFFAGSYLPRENRGRQMGLHPLLTLMAFYLGYRLMGVAGMILLPIGAMVSKQLVDLLEPVRERQSPGHEADRTRISCTRSQAGARKRADN